MGSRLPLVQHIGDCAQVTAQRSLRKGHCAKVAAQRSLRKGHGSPSTGQHDTEVTYSPPNGRRHLASTHATSIHFTFPHVSSRFLTLSPRRNTEPETWAHKPMLKGHTDERREGEKRSENSVQKKKIFHAFTRQRLSSSHSCFSLSRSSQRIFTPPLRLPNTLLTPFRRLPTAFPTPPPSPPSPLTSRS